MSKDIVFTCMKCGHLLFVSDISFEKLVNIMNKDCPTCGEEGYENWILSRTGNFDEEYGEQE